MRSLTNSTARHVSEITGLNLNKEIKVYVTHPSLRNGRYWGNNKLSWGHAEDWPNYTVVYLWHEILHSYLGYGDLDHAVIELIADNELRSFLSGKVYPPLLGHENLSKIKNRLLPEWRKCLASDDRDVMKWLEGLTSSEDLSTQKKPS